VFAFLAANRHEIADTVGLLSAVDGLCSESAPGRKI
jgi:hypothetical protein